MKKVVKLMQRAEMGREQEPLQQQCEDLKAEIASLAKQREALEQENARCSPLRQKLSRYIGFGTVRKLEWITYKLKFKEEQLAVLVNHPEVETNEDTTPHSLAPPPSVSEIIQEKLARMVSENPVGSEPDIRRVYQRLNATEQKVRPNPVK